jgi:uncharacterized alpha-E superfamily protein
MWSGPSTSPAFSMPPRALTNLPSAYGGAGTEWQSAVATAGCEDTFAKAYGEANERNVCDFLSFNPDNPSSIRNCFALARSNARAVRTALTSEMWDALNGAWLELQRFERKRMDREEFARFLDWVKSVSLAFDGSAYRTMLRDDGYWFSRLGVNVERADNTARILDVKYHVLLPETEQVGGSLDYFQWTTMLRRGLGADRLSLGLPPGGEAGADRRSAHPQPAHAALAGELLREHLAFPRPDRRCL